jgi:hypothetical protein
MDTIKKYHKELIRYKNKHLGETCYILGTGKTLNKFKMIEKGILIGVNGIIKSDLINNELFKYYFFGHGFLHKHKTNNISGTSKEREMENKRFVEEYQNVDKFCMVSKNEMTVGGEENSVSFDEEDIKYLLENDVIPFDVTEKKINKNLEESSFLNHSIIYPAIQFALYSGFKKIYLVGCDCIQYSLKDFDKYRFYKNKDYEEKEKIINKIYIKWWRKMYNFKQKNYLGVRILNINPMGLKGRMDEDIYI